MSKKDKKPFDIEDRLIDFAVRIIRTAETLPKISSQQLIEFLPSTFCGSLFCGSAVCCEIPSRFGLTAIRMGRTIEKEAA